MDKVKRVEKKLHQMAFPSSKSGGWIKDKNYTEWRTKNKSISPVSKQKLSNEIVDVYSEASGTIHSVGIRKLGILTTKKQFKTKLQAIAFAKRYMREN